MNAYNRFCRIALLMLPMCLFGCRPAAEQTQSVSELVSSYRTQLVVDDEPTGAMGILELRSKMEGIDDSHEEHDHGDHADHDHAEHADHDHTEHADDDHADHGHAEHAGDEHAQDGDHNHDDHADHDHAADAAQHGNDSVAIESMPNITVVGKIAKKSGDGGVEASEFPWEKGVAVFVIVDPAGEGEAEEHQHKDGEECLFCSKKKIEAQAIVQFSQPNGQPISVDARELFGLKMDDIVVVHGNARLTGGVLMIDGIRLHARK